MLIFQFELQIEVQFSELQWNMNKGDLGCSVVLTFSFFFFFNGPPTEISTTTLYKISNEFQYRLHFTHSCSFNYWTLSVLILLLYCIKMHETFPAQAEIWSFCSRYLSAITNYFCWINTVSREEPQGAFSYKLVRKGPVPLHTSDSVIDIPHLF